MIVDSSIDLFCFMDFGHGTWRSLCHSIGILALALPASEPTQICERDAHLENQGMDWRCGAASSSTRIAPREASVLDENPTT